MPSIQRFGRFTAVLAATVVALIAPGGAMAQGMPGEPFSAVRLLADDAGTVIARPIDDSTVVRRRSIAFDAAGLNAIRTGRNLSLNLFGDVALPAQAERSWADRADTFHWQGHVLGEPERSVIIVLHRGALRASISTHIAGWPAAYRIRSHRDLGQVVEEIDQSKFAPCGCTTEHHVGGPLAIGRDALHGSRAARDGRPSVVEGGIAGTIVNCLGPTIDVMIVYTPEARDLEGGTAGIEALAIAQEDICNVAYLNSEVVQRVQVVHIAEVAYVETGAFSTELSRLRNTSDGHMDIVHPLRDTHGADLVALFVSGGNACGIAYLMTKISPEFAPSGFSVTATGCAQGNLTFQHELGHNMGCHHDHDNSGPAGAFTWSHGHRFFGTNGTQYRTIMAYAPGNRVPHFSNPDILYQGTPTGVPIGIPDVEAHNADTLNATGETIADFRPSATPPDPDCNSNGIADECDILNGTSLDLNGNGIPDECEPPPPTCPGDIEPPGGNGEVDVDDLIAVILAWGDCPPPPAGGGCPADIDRSGTVDVDDLIAVILNWGPCP